MKKNFLQVAAAVVLALVTSCGRQAEKITTGESLDRIHILALLPGTFGSPSYAVVQSSALPGFEDRMLSAMSSLGLAGKWRARENCTFFADAYVLAARSQYELSAQYSFTLPTSLAVAEVWYHPDGSKPDVGHAIVAAITENGLQFIEPQNGAVIKLTDTERSSVYFCRW